MASNFPAEPGTSGTQTKTVKVWNYNKTKGKVISIIGYVDLVTKVKQKFDLSELGAISIVCEDGCEIEEDEGLIGLTESTLYFLRENEQLCVKSESVEKSSFQMLVDNLKRKRGLKESETSQKKEKMTLKSTLGWMHFNTSQKRYIAVRTQRGGGIRTEELLRTITYEEVKEKLQQTFFPNGRSPLGKLVKFNCGIGDSRGNAMDRNDFSLDNGCRIYLLTKEKVFLLDSSDSDSDFVLPQIEFTRAKTPTVHHLPNTDEPFSTSSPMPTAILSQHSDSGTPTVSFNPDSLKCSVCYERQRTHFTIPCGHQYCLVCSTTLEGNSGTCAFCRAPIQSLGKLQNS